MDPIVRYGNASEILRALWRDVPTTEPMFDVFKRLHCEETQHHCECGSLTAQMCLSCFRYVYHGCCLHYTTMICHAVE